MGIAKPRSARHMIDELLMDFIKVLEEPTPPPAEAENRWYSTALNQWKIWVGPENMLWLTSNIQYLMLGVSFTLCVSWAVLHQVYVRYRHRRQKGGGRVKKSGASISQSGKDPKSVLEERSLTVSTVKSEAAQAKLEPQVKSAATPLPSKLARKYRQASFSHKTNSTPPPASPREQTRNPVPSAKSHKQQIRKCSPRLSSSRTKHKTPQKANSPKKVSIAEQVENLPKNIKLPSEVKLRTKNDTSELQKDQHGAKTKYRDERISKARGQIKNDRISKKSPKYLNQVVAPAASSAHRPDANGAPAAAHAPNLKRKYFNDDIKRFKCGEADVTGKGRVRIDTFQDVTCLDTDRVRRKHKISCDPRSPAHTISPLRRHGAGDSVQTLKDAKSNSSDTVVELHNIPLKQHRRDTQMQVFQMRAQSGGSTMAMRSGVRHSHSEDVSLACLKCSVHNHRPFDIPHFMNKYNCSDCGLPYALDDQSALSFQAKQTRHRTDRTIVSFSVPSSSMSACPAVMVCHPNWRPRPRHSGQDFNYIVNPYNIRVQNCSPDTEIFRACSFATSYEVSYTDTNLWSGNNSAKLTEEYTGYQVNSKPTDDSICLSISQDTQSNGRKRSKFPGSQQKPMGEFDTGMRVCSRLVLSTHTKKRQSEQTEAGKLVQQQTLSESVMSYNVKMPRPKCECIGCQARAKKGLKTRLLSHMAPETPRLSSSSSSCEGGRAGPSGIQEYKLRRKQEKVPDADVLHEARYPCSCLACMTGTNYKGKTDPPPTAGPSSREIKPEQERSEQDCPQMSKESIPGKYSKSMKRKSYYYKLLPLGRRPGPDTSSHTSSNCVVYQGNDSEIVHTGTLDKIGSNTTCFPFSESSSELHALREDLVPKSESFLSDKDGRRPPRKMKNAIRYVHRKNVEDLGNLVPQRQMNEIQKGDVDRDYDQPQHKGKAKENPEYFLKISGLADVPKSRVYERPGTPHVSAFRPYVPDRHSRQQKTNQGASITQTYAPKEPEPVLPIPDSSQVSSTDREVKSHDSWKDLHPQRTNARTVRKVVNIPSLTGMRDSHGINPRATSKSDVGTTENSERTTNEQNEKIQQQRAKPVPVAVKLRDYLMESSMKVSDLYKQNPSQTSIQGVIRRKANVPKFQPYGCRRDEKYKRVQEKDDKDILSQIFPESLRKPRGKSSRRRSDFRGVRKSFTAPEKDNVVLQSSFLFDNSREEKIMIFSESSFEKAERKRTKENAKDKDVILEYSSQHESDSGQTSLKFSRGGSQRSLLDRPTSRGLDNQARLTPDRGGNHSSSGSNVLARRPPVGKFSSRSSSRNGTNLELSFSGSQMNPESNWSTETVLGVSVRSPNLSDMAIDTHVYLRNKTDDSAENSWSDFSVDLPRPAIRRDVRNLFHKRSSSRRTSDETQTPINFDIRVRNESNFGHSYNRGHVKYPLPSSKQISTPTQTSSNPYVRPKYKSRLPRYVKNKINRGSQGRQRNLNVQGPSPLDSPTETPGPRCHDGPEAGEGGHLYREHAYERGPSIKEEMTQTNLEEDAEEKKVIYIQGEGSGQTRLAETGNTSDPPPREDAGSLTPAAAGSIQAFTQELYHRLNNVLPQLLGHRNEPIIIIAPDTLTSEQQKDRPHVQSQPDPEPVVSNQIRAHVKCTSESSISDHYSTLVNKTEMTIDTPTVSPRHQRRFKSISKNSLVDKWLRTKENVPAEQQKTNIPRRKKTTYTKRERTPRAGPEDPSRNQREKVLSVRRRRSSDASKESPPPLTRFAARIPRDTDEEAVTKKLKASKSPKYPKDRLKSLQAKGYVDRREMQKPDASTSSQKMNYSGRNKLPVQRTPNFAGQSPRQSKNVTSKLKPNLTPPTSARHSNVNKKPPTKRQTRQVTSKIKTDNARKEDPTPRKRFPTKKDDGICTSDDDAEENCTAETHRVHEPALNGHLTFLQERISTPRFDTSQPDTDDIIQSVERKFWADRQERSRTPAPDTPTSKKRYGKFRKTTYSFDSLEPPRVKPPSQASASDPVQPMISKSSTSEGERRVLSPRTKRSFSHESLHQEPVIPVRRRNIKCKRENYKYPPTPTENIRASNASPQNRQNEESTEEKLEAEADIPVDEGKSQIHNVHVAASATDRPTGSNEKLQVPAMNVQTTGKMQIIQSDSAPFQVARRKLTHSTSTIGKRSGKKSKLLDPIEKAAARQAEARQKAMKDKLQNVIGPHSPPPPAVTVKYSRQQIPRGPRPAQGASNRPSSSMEEKPAEMPSGAPSVKSLSLRGIRSKYADLQAQRRKMHEKQTFASSQKMKKTPNSVFPVPVAKTAEKRYTLPEPDQKVVRKLNKSQRAKLVDDSVRNKLNVGNTSRNKMTNRLKRPNSPYWQKSDKRKLNLAPRERDINNDVHDVRSRVVKTSLRLPSQTRTEGDKCSHKCSKVKSYRDAQWQEPKDADVKRILLYDPSEETRQSKAAAVNDTRKRAEVSVTNKKNISPLDYMDRRIREERVSRDKQRPGYREQVENISSDDAEQYRLPDELPGKIRGSAENSASSDILSMFRIKTSDILADTEFDRSTEDKLLSLLSKSQTTARLDNRSKKEQKNALSHSASKVASKNRSHTIINPLRLEEQSVHEQSPPHLHQRGARDRMVSTEEHVVNEDTWGIETKTSTRSKRSESNFNALQYTADGASIDQQKFSFAGHSELHRSSYTPTRERFTVSKLENFGSERDTTANVSALRSSSGIYRPAWTSPKRTEPGRPRSSPAAIMQTVTTSEEEGVAEYRLFEPMPDSTTGAKHQLCDADKPFWYRKASRIPPREIVDAHTNVSDTGADGNTWAQASDQYNKRLLVDTGNSPSPGKGISPVRSGSYQCLRLTESVNSDSVVHARSESSACVVHPYMVPPKVGKGRKNQNLTGQMKLGQEQGRDATDSSNVHKTTHDRSDYDQARQNGHEKDTKSKPLSQGHRWDKFDLDSSAPDTGDMLKGWLEYARGMAPEARSTSAFSQTDTDEKAALADTLPLRTMWGFQDQAASLFLSSTGRTSRGRDTGSSSCRLRRSSSSISP